jgi:hypothetical protein
MSRMRVELGLPIYDEPRAQGNCGPAVVLGDLSQTTVVVLNDDLFPEGVQVYPDEEGHYSLKDQSAVILYFLQFCARTTSSKTRTGLVCRLWPGIEFILYQFLMMVALDKAIPNRDIALLVVLSISTVLLQCMGAAVDNAFRGLEIENTVLMHLRDDLLQTAIQLRSPCLHVCTFFRNMRMCTCTHGQTGLEASISISKNHKRTIKDTLITIENPVGHLIHLMQQMMARV